jgi:hypothetical protein
MRKENPHCWKSHYIVYRETKFPLTYLPQNDFGNNFFEYTVRKIFRMIKYFIMNFLTILFSKKVESDNESISTSTKSGSEGRQRIRL